MKQDINNERLGMQMVQQSVIELSKKEELLPSYVLRTDNSHNIATIEQTCLPVACDVNIGLCPIAGGDEQQTENPSPIINNIVNVIDNNESNQLTYEELFNRSWNMMKALFSGEEWNDELMESEIKMAIKIHQRELISHSHNLVDCTIQKTDAAAHTKKIHEDNYDSAMRFIL